MLPQILLLPTSIVIKNIHNCKTETFTIQNLAMTLLIIIDYQSNFQLRVLKHSVPKTTYNKNTYMHTIPHTHTHTHAWIKRSVMVSV